MKLLIFGNIGCGKSSISNEIINSNKTFSLINIDDFRRNFGDGSMKKERLAKANFIEAIDINTSNQIIECSGLGDTGEMVFERLCKSDDVKIVIVLLAEPSICNERLKNRIWDIPYPDKTSNVSKLIEKQSVIYKTDELKDKWSKQTQTIFFIFNNNNIEEFQKNCQLIKSLINEAKRNN